MFSRDGKTFACSTFNNAAAGTNSVELIDVASGKSRARIDSPLIGDSSGRSLEDGRTLRLLAVDKFARDLMDVDLATGEVKSTRRLSCPMAAAYLATSSDCRLMAYSPAGLPAGMSIRIWDLDLDREAYVLKDPSTAIPS